MGGIRMWKMLYTSMFVWVITTEHYDDVIMGVIASQITSLAIVYSTVYSGANQNKHQSSASLAFVWGIQRGSVNSPYKWPVTRKMFPFDDVIMKLGDAITHSCPNLIWNIVVKVIPYECKVLGTTFIKLCCIANLYISNQIFPLTASKIMNSLISNLLC